jgi:hypothetical protein
MPKFTLTRRHASSNPDRELESYFKQSLRNQFPNPEREGCPEQRILEGLALGKIPLNKVAPWLEHLGRCSACFRDFKRFRAMKDYRLRVRLSWAAAAVLVVGLFLTFWLNQIDKEKNDAQTAVGQRKAHLGAGKVSEEPLAVAILHFENPSTTRGGTGKPLKLQQVPRTRVTLSIYLPPSDDPGKFEVELVKETTDLTPLARFSGNATIENGVPVLRTTVDLSGLVSGTYIARFRRVGGLWRYSSIVLS